MHKHKTNWTLTALVLSSLAAGALLGQTPAQTDVLILTDGEKLIGHLEGSTSTKVTFKSDIVGEITVDWSKIQELHTAGKFAVAKKGQTFTKHDDPNRVPQGAISVTDRKVEVTPAEGQSPTAIPVLNVQNVVDQSEFLSAFRRRRFTQDWTGAASLGIALTEATQNSRSIASSLSLVRTSPNESWIDPRTRTTFDFNSAFGQLTQPGIPTVKTNIIHADAEQDFYVSSRTFLFVNGAWDHNYSQGLDLQQTYGGGIGYTFFKTDASELDLKASIDYINQRFIDSALNKSLVGAVLGETYNRTLLHGITLHEGITFIPAFNNSSAWSSNGVLNLAFPVYKRLTFTIGMLDAFLNDPPPGFKKNSFTFTTNVGYTIK